MISGALAGLIGGGFAGLQIAGASAQGDLGDLGTGLGYMALGAIAGLVAGLLIAARLCRSVSHSR